MKTIRMAAILETANNVLSMQIAAPGIKFWCLRVTEGFSRAPPV
jgi:hypothetical protein